MQTKAPYRYSPAEIATTRQTATAYRRRWLDFGNFSDLRKAENSEAVLAYQISTTR